MSGPSRIARAFTAAKQDDRAAFVPFLMGGDPSLEITVDLVEALDRAGADVVELGVPFSDPMADGPVNQAAAERALAAGATLERLLAAVTEIRRRSEIPIVLFSYANPISRYGVERFAEHARACGVDGVLVVDLPPEEARHGWLAALRDHDLDPIFLLAPTSTPRRIRALRRLARGFVYFVSRTGVTGERSELPRELARQVRAARKGTGRPVAVGFGVSTPEQVAEVARIADGVVVGSALVRWIGEHALESDLVERFAGLAWELAEATRRDGRGA